MGYGGSFSPGIGTIILVFSTYSATDTYNDKDKCNDKDKDKYMTRGGVEGIVESAGYQKVFCFGNLVPRHI